MNAFTVIVCIAVAAITFKQADAFCLGGCKTRGIVAKLSLTKYHHQPTRMNSFLFNSDKDDTTSDLQRRRKRDIIEDAVFAVKKSLIGIFALISIVVLGGPRSAFARSGSNLRSIAAVVKPSKKVAQNEKSRGKVRLDVVVEDDNDDDFDLEEEEAEERQKLTRIGLLLVGATGVATILLGDGGKKSKKGKNKKSVSSGKKGNNKPTTTAIAKKIQMDIAPKKKSSKAPKGIFDDEEEEQPDDEEEEAELDFAVEKKSKSAAKSLSKMAEDEKETLATASRISSRLRKGLGASLPPADELFGEDDEISNIFKSDEETVTSDRIQDDDDVPIKSSSKRSIDDDVTAPAKKKSLTSKFTKREPVSEPTLPPAVVDNDEDYSQPEPLAVPTPASAPAPAPAKKGIFDRIFQRSTTNRPTDIDQVLQLGDVASPFRFAVASILASSLPQGSFPLVQEGGVYAVPDLPGDLDGQSSLLVTTRSEANLDDRQAAEAFADVANAMLVTLVDRAAQAMDAKGDKEEVEKAAVEQLDLLTSCAQSAGGLFMKVLPRVILEDGGIKYNGGAKKNKLENLYFQYTKASMMSMGNSFADVMKAAQAQEAGAVAEAEESVEPTIDRNARLPVLQHVLSIKESKRTSLEQKATKEVMMSMMSGFGGEGMGGLGDMMGALTGKGGGAGGGIDEAALQELMNSMGGADGAGGMPPGMPDLGDMSPDQMAGMFEEVVSSLKQSLEEGTVTKQEVKDMEKQLGMPLKEMVKVMEMGGANKGIPQFKELLDVFKRLSQI